MEKIKNVSIIIVFAVLIFGLGILHWLTPDLAVSASERRKLEQLPEVSVQSVFDGKYSQKLESYLLDQFPARDGFRTIKAALRFGLFQQKDSNGIYLVGDSVFKIEYPLKENQVLYGADKLNQVYDKYLTGMNVFYSIIPDKNYFAAEENGYPTIDYDRLVSLMKENVENIDYIDIFQALTIDDYYRTDAHWKQENVYGAAQVIADGLGVELTPESEFAANMLEPFYGVYCGQSALPVKPDVLTYMTSAMTESAVVTGVELDGEKPVYDPTLFVGMDGYDVFLSGAQSIVTIDCTNADTDRELVIFRDSFGSSLAPYFCGAYSKITLVDLRYITTDMVGEYVDFENQDVLFIYSTSLLNSAMLLK